MKLKFKFNLRRELKIVGALAIVVVIIAFTEGRQSEVFVKDIAIKIENIEGNYVALAFTHR